MEERIYFLSDLIIDKMKSLKYNDIVIRNFQTSYLELVKNAIEYGTNGKDIKIIFEITNTYISTIIYNSKNKKFDFKNYIENLEKDDYKFDVNSNSGRGLIYAYHVVDKLINISNIGIKFTLYKELVELEIIFEEELLIIIVKSELNNPSVINKIRKEINKSSSRNIIICLNKELYHSYQDIKNKSDSNTDVYSQILNIIKEKEEHNIKIVHSNGTMQNLLSKKYFYTDLRETINAFHCKD
jgi:anti-sigma regulatory factor (Ser/Thr protein kinase)